MHLIISDLQNNALNIVLKARQQTFYVVQHEVFIGDWGTELALDSQNLLKSQDWMLSYIC